MYICKIKALDIWHVLSNFVIVDIKLLKDSMPHLFNIEKKIILYMIWEENPSLHEVISGYLE